MAKFHCFILFYQLFKLHLFYKNSLFLFLVHLLAGNVLDGLALLSKRGDAIYSYGRLIDLDKVLTKVLIKINLPLVLRVSSRVYVVSCILYCIECTFKDLFQNRNT